MFKRFLSFARKVWNHLTADTSFYNYNFIEEHYLKAAVDLADLERRQKEIERGRLRNFPY